MLSTLERKRIKYNVLKSLGLSGKAADRLAASDESYINALREIMGLSPIDLKTFGEE